MRKNIVTILSVFLAAHLISFLISGCAQIGAPTGGPKDTIPPKLLKAIPEVSSINFTGNKIILSFDEFVDLQDLQNNLLISPLQKTSAIISSNLKTVTVKFKDTLLPNTTYNVNFGDAIKDINEGNVLKNFSYVFSTGNTIDSLELKGKLLMAQTGKVDSTLMILLYRNSTDTAVTSKRPDYITKLKGDGSFIFKYLPSDNFNIYALKDGDGNKYYNAKTEVFAFINETFNTAVYNPPITLYAYAEKTQTSPPPVSLEKKDKEKKLRYNNNLISGSQDLLESLLLSFKNGLKKIDIDSIILCDTGYKKIAGTVFTIDSTRKKISIKNNWVPGMPMKLIVFKNALEDSTGLMLSSNDTISFIAKNNNEYGSLKLKFKNIDLDLHPLLQFMDGENIKWKFPVVANDWSVKMILPGEYEIRILYDINNNGQWDPGDYSKKIQPEKTIALPQKVSIKADWENEREIDLKQQ